jgi:hypothetical protein
MQLIRQPAGSSLCGQCCVAMAAGISLEMVRAIFGHARGTGTVEVRRALRILGVQCASRLTYSSALPQYGIVKLRRPRGSRHWHWVLMWDGVMYDPENDPEYFADWRAEAYLGITPETFPPQSVAELSHHVAHAQHFDVTGEDTNEPQAHSRARD